MNQLIAIPAHEVTGLAHGVTNAEDMESPEAPINGLNARYGVFWISSQPVSTWRTALFSPVQMVASATDRHAAATTAVRYLVAMDEIGLALVVRNRDTGKNEGLIKWVEQCSPYSSYRYHISTEDWA